MTQHQSVAPAPDDLFEGAAYYFARYQADYPATMFEFLAGNYLVDPSADDLLDLGCGTGQFAVPLSKFARHVVAVDPDSGMIAEARRLAEANDAANISFLSGRSEELLPELGSFSLVTIAGAFHWMDRETVLAKLSAKVSDQGAIAIISRVRTNCEPRDWFSEQLRYIEDFWGGHFPAGKDGIRPTLAESNEAILRRSAFRNVERQNFSYEHRWDIDSLMGYILSTSKACPGVLGDRRSEFELGMRSHLLEMSPAGSFIERGNAEVLLARRRG